MNLDLSQFKKIKDSKDMAILQHPSGHRIEIAKSSLSPKHSKDLEKLPIHMDVGGAVPGDGSDAQPMPQNQQQPTIIINNGQPQGPIAQQPGYDPNAPWKPMGPTPMQQMTMDSPTAAPSDKLQALEALQKQEQQNLMRDQAYAQKKHQEMLAAIEYNKRAQQMGQPQIAVPNAPPVQVASVGNDAGLMGDGQGLSQSGLAPQQPQAPTDPWGTQAHSDAVTQGMQNQIQGYQQEARALGEKGRQEEAALKQSIEAQNQRAQSYQQNFDALQKERDAFMSDLQNKAVDPRRFYNNMGTGQKISTAIGLILGGMGGGLLKQENPVMKYLNQQITNDIEAQKADINKSNTLLSANYQSFGNLKDATDMTRVMLNDVVINQLKQAAAQTQDPIAKARAMQKIGELMQTNAPVLSQIAMRKTILGGMQSGSTNPGQVIRMLIPEAQQAAAYKELGDAQEMVKARDATLSAFEKVAKLNTLSSRAGSPIQSGKQIEALINPLLMELAKDTAGKFSEMEYNELKPLMPGLLDDENTLNLKKQKLLAMIQKKMNTPILSSYGINFGNVQAGGRYGSTGEKTIKLGAPVPVSGRGE